MEDKLRTLLDQFPDPVTADMNRLYFKGSDLDLPQLEEALKSAPFLADRRLVVLEDASSALRKSDSRERLLHILDEIPSTTAFVLLDERDFSKDKDLQSYRQRSPLFRWTQSHPQKGFSMLFRLPTGAAFVQWLRSECQSLGGALEPEAALLLADYVADDTYLARSELQKLLSYVDGARPIKVADIEELTPLYGQADIFEMVDALGERDMRSALGLLERLIQSREPRFAFAMIVRQIRLLIMAREALEAGSDAQAALDIHPYVARKVTKQARNFEMAQLEALHSSMLKLDLDSKSGRADLVTGLFRLLSSLTPL